MAYVDALPRGGLIGFDRAEREAAVMRHIEDALIVRRDLPPDAECQFLASEFARFAAFARHMDVSPLPASGHVVAFWLMDLIARDATLDEIATSAFAIKFAHDTTRNFLDWAPINAALDFAIEHRS